MKKKVAVRTGRQNRARPRPTTSAFEGERTMTTLRTIRNLSLAAILCLLPTHKLFSADHPPYENAAANCDQAVQARLVKVSDDYVHNLKTLQDYYRQRGDLDETLAVKKEKERFESEKTMQDKNIVKAPDQLK